MTAPPRGVRREVVSFASSEFELGSSTVNGDGFDLRWRGAGLDEHAIEAASRRVVVRIDPRYYRPTEVQSLLGDATKVRLTPDWKALGIDPATAKAGDPETGEPIGVKRLEARPVATLSVEAQERRERREKQFGDRDDFYR